MLLLLLLLVVHKLRLFIQRLVRCSTATGCCCCCCGTRRTHYARICASIWIHNRTSGANSSLLLLRLFVSSACKTIAQHKQCEAGKNQTNLAEEERREKEIRLVVSFTLMVVCVECDYCNQHSVMLMVVVLVVYLLLVHSRVEQRKRVKLGGQAMAKQPFGGQSLWCKRKS